MNSPKEALAIVLGKAMTNDGTIQTGGLTSTQKEELDRRSDPSFVARKNRNPFSLESKIRRQAESAALVGRLDIFRDQILALRKSNEVLNRAAITQVVYAAETFLTGVIADAVEIKYCVKSDAMYRIKNRLEEELIDLEERRKREVIPADMIEALQTSTLNRFAAEISKAGNVDVVFEKDKLLSIEFSPSGNKKVS